QLPWLPEQLAALGGAAAIVRGLRRSARPGAFDEAELVQVARGWSASQLRTMIHWYRALRLAPAAPAAAPAGRVRVPTRVIWGARDAFIGREFAADSVALCERGELQLLQDATHWLQHEEPERVNAGIAGWVAAHAG